MMWAIQYKSPHTKGRWWWVESKAPGDTAIIGSGRVHEPRWLYPTSTLAIRFAEQYRAGSFDDSEWRVVSVPEVRN